MNTMKNTTNSIEVRERDGMGVLVELYGEFDVHDLDSLREILGETRRLEPPVHVDLSKVTFLDAWCARELVVRSCLYGGDFVLRVATWQAQASFRACGLGVWTADYLGSESSQDTKARNHVGTKPHEDLAMVV